jgi:hypothetical protein
MTTRKTDFPVTVICLYGITIFTIYYAPGPGSHHIWQYVFYTAESVTLQVFCLTTVLFAKIT